MLLEQIVPKHGVMEDYEVEQEFPNIGHRTMCLNARQVVYKAGAASTILLGIEDITERLILEREKDELLRQKEVMLDELRHRVANSLQIIAGIILMKATRAESQEIRSHLQDAHKRVMSIAAVQQQLHAFGTVGPIDMMPYLSKLCETIATSMIGDNRQITIKVVGACDLRVDRALVKGVPPNTRRGSITAFSAPCRLGFANYPWLDRSPRASGAKFRERDHGGSE